MSQGDNFQTLPQKRGIDKNLFIKKFINSITYSPSQIKINLYFSNEFEKSNNSCLDKEGQKNREKIRSEFSPQIPEPQVRNSKIGSPVSFKSNCQIPIIIPNVIHQCKKKDL